MIAPDNRPSPADNAVPTKVSAAFTNDPQSILVTKLNKPDKEPEIKDKEFKGWYTDAKDSAKK